MEDDYVTESYAFNDPSNEPRPKTVVYTEEFRELKRQCKEVLRLLSHPLEDSKLDNAITKGLLKEIAKRAKEKHPDQTLFALVGPMSAGMLAVGAYRLTDD